MAVVTPTSIAALWQSTHRGSLHSAESWDGASTPRLTYTCTNAGFHGEEQMAQFCAAYPPQLHLLHPGQLRRFDNHIKTLSLVVDEERNALVEECLVSLFHHEPVDWLAPGVQPCKRQVDFALTFIVKYNGPLLGSVRVSWDSGLVLKQMLPRPFDEVPILTARQFLARTSEPCEANSNPFSRLLTPAVALKKTVLDGMKSLLTDLPDAPVTPARHRKLPALESCIFRSTCDSPAMTPGLAQPKKKVHAAQASQIVFDDRVVAPKATGIEFQNRLFVAEGTDAVQQPPPHLIKRIDAKKLESRVFDDKLEFTPSVALDKERLKSTVFDSESALDRPVFKSTSHLDSRIFDHEEAPIHVRPNNYNASHFTLAPGDNELVTPHAVDLADRNCASHFSGMAATEDAPSQDQPRVSAARSASHFQPGSSFDLPETPSDVSVATKPTQSFVFQSSIVFGGGDDPNPPATAVPKNSKTASQVCFDAEAALPTIVPARKISNQSGGKSQIIF